MTKRTLMFQMITVAGAGTYAATLIKDDGLTVSKTSYKPSKKSGITKVVIMGAAGHYITMTRSDHQADNMELVQIADTLADQDKLIDLYKILGNRGATLNANEALSMTATVTGNANINILIEVDDAVPTTNCRAVIAAGVNAAVADDLVETGGNMVSALQPNSQYRLRGTYMTSTTAQAIMVTLLKRSYVLLPAQNAVVTGQPYTILSDDQVAVLTGTGAEFSNQFLLYLLASAADAAATQRFHFIFEASE